jgi:hypothetical protein
MTEQIKRTEAEVLKFCLNYLLTKGYFGQGNEYGGRVNTMGTARIGANGRQFYTKNENLYKGLPDIMFFAMRDKLGEKEYLPYRGGQTIIRMGKYNNPHLVMVGVEVKSSVGKQSPAQIQFQKLLEASGGLYLLVSKPEDIESIF